MREFVDRHGLQDMTIIADEAGDIWGRFGVVGQPTWSYVEGDSGTAETRPGALGEAGILEVFASDAF